MDTKFARLFLEGLSFQQRERDGETEYPTEDESSN